MDIEEEIRVLVSYLKNEVDGEDRYFDFKRDEILVSDPDHLCITVAVIPKDFPIEGRKIDRTPTILEISVFDGETPVLEYGENGENCDIDKENFYQFMYWDKVT